MIKLFLSLLLITSTCYAQINISTGAVIRLSGGAKLIVTNPISNGIVGGLSGGILTETENDEVILLTNTSTGIFNIPFTNTNLTAIPFTYTITTPGVGTNSSIRFSSWSTIPINTPTPLSVPYNTLTNNYGIPNFYKIVDRFWSIEPIGYTSKPQGVYKFTYDELEIASPNTIVEANLAAQRWNDTDDLWGDWLYSPTANTTNNTVTITISNIEDQFSIWTLVDNADPLPIGLIRFNTECNDDFVNISWSNLNEIGIDYYAVMRSRYGLDFQDIKIVYSDNVQNTPISYQVNDYDFISGTSYYKLKIVNTNNEVEYSPVVANTCEQTISIYPNPTNNVLYINNAENYTIELYDSKGSLILNYINKNDIIDLSGIASGNYLLRINNNISYKTFKLLKK